MYIKSIEIMNYSNVNVLLGKTITSIEGMVKESEEVLFYCSDGSVYKMWHEQDCCEIVLLDDIVGDITDLINNPITLAEESSSGSNEDKEGYGYETFTFYKFATIKGYLNIKWWGQSNGYYSEDVSFAQIQ